MFLPISGPVCLIFLSRIISVSYVTTWQNFGPHNISRAFPRIDGEMKIEAGERGEPTSSLDNVYQASVVIAWQINYGCMVNPVPLKFLQDD